MYLGLCSLHHKKIIHTDLKSTNIFLTKEDGIHIGDLGVAKAMTRYIDWASSMIRYPYYLSPEMCGEKPYNIKSDIWALGCILYEMCAQKHPFKVGHEVNASLILKMLKGKFDPIPERYSTEITEIIKACLCPDHHQRPSADDLLKRPALIAKARELNISVEPEIKAANEVAKSPQTKEKDNAW